MKLAPTFLTGIIAVALLAIVVLDIPMVRYIAVAIIGISVILINQYAREARSDDFAQKTLKENTENLNIASHDLNRLFELLESAVKEDLVVVKQELLQIKGLVNNAVSELTQCFYEISSNSEEQYRLVRKTIESLPDTRDELVLSSLEISNTKIKNSNASAIRSLQFDDIVIQVSDNSLQYLDNLDKFLNEFRQKLLDRIKSENTSDNTGTTGLLKSCVTDVEQIRQLIQLPDRKAVHQNNLSEGGVELF